MDYSKPYAALYVWLKTGDCETYDKGPVYYEIKGSWIIVQEGKTADSKHFKKTIYSCNYVDQVLEGGLYLGES